jgi:hypothetical protein
MMRILLLLLSIGLVSCENVFREVQKNQGSPQESGIIGVRADFHIASDIEEDYNVSFDAGDGARYNGSAKDLPSWRHSNGLIEFGIPNPPADLLTKPGKYSWPCTDLYTKYKDTVKLYTDSQHDGLYFMVDNLNNFTCNHFNCLAEYNTALAARSLALQYRDLILGGSWQFGRNISAAITDVRRVSNRTLSNAGDKDKKEVYFSLTVADGYTITVTYAPEPDLIELSGDKQTLTFYGNTRAQFSISGGGQRKNYTFLGYNWTNARKIPAKQQIIYSSRLNSYDAEKASVSDSAAIAAPVTRELPKAEAEPSEELKTRDRPLTKADKRAKVRTRHNRQGGN